MYVEQLVDSILRMQSAAAGRAAPEAVEPRTVEVGLVPLVAAEASKAALPTGLAAQHKVAGEGPRHIAVQEGRQGMPAGLQLGPLLSADIPQRAAPRIAAQVGT